MQIDKEENNNMANDLNESYLGRKRIIFYQSNDEQREIELLQELQLTAVERLQTTVNLIRRVYSKHLQMITPSNRITFNKK